MAPYGVIIIISIIIVIIIVIIIIISSTHIISFSIIVIIINISISSISIGINIISYTLRREYRVVINRNSRLLFTSENRLCANLRVKEQLTHVTSQYQYLAFAWRHRSAVVTSQC